MEKHELIQKRSTEFVAHNMLMNYWLCYDNLLLIESFIKNFELEINFDVNHYHFCITGVDSKYNNYTKSDSFEDVYKRQDYFQSCCLSDNKKRQS